MNYIKYLFSAKWLVFTSIFLFLNIAAAWAINQDSTNWGWVVGLILALDVLLVYFSYDEYKNLKK